jgi:hypothetical protein
MEFYAANADNWITVCAFGDWHAQVPKDFVGVVAMQGGRSSFHADQSIAGKPERFFLVPKDEYTGGARGFVIDLERHQETTRFN